MQALIYLFIFFFLNFFFSTIVIKRLGGEKLYIYIYIYIYICIYIYLFIYLFFPSLACQKDITCYLNPNSVQVSVLIQDIEYRQVSLWYVYLYNSPSLGGKWRKSFLIGQYHFKNSLAVAFNFSFVCTVCFCMLGVFFTAGSPAGTKVSVGSLGRASMMLEDPKLVRTPRTSLTRRFCALF